MPKVKCLVKLAETPDRRLISNLTQDIGCLSKPRKLSRPRFVIISGTRLPPYLD